MYIPHLPSKQQLQARKKIKEDRECIRKEYNEIMNEKITFDLTYGSMVPKYQQPINPQTIPHNIVALPDTDDSAILNIQTGMFITNLIILVINVMMFFK